MCAHRKHISRPYLNGLLEREDKEKKSDAAIGKMMYEKCSPLEIVSCDVVVAVNWAGANATDFIANIVTHDYGIITNDTVQQRNDLNVSCIPRDSQPC